MSRYAVAMTLSSWKKKGRRGKRRRGAKAGGGARRRGARAAPRTTSAPEADRPKFPSRRGEGRRGGPRSREELAPEPELDETELEDELDEETEPDEAESDDEDGGDEDLGEDRPRGRRRRERRGERREEGQRRGLGARVRDAVTRDWQKPQALGPGMRIQTRRGLRAAIVEVKPGLFVVAEVPAESVEFGFGPMLLAPALMKTLGRALQGRKSAGRAGRAHRPELSTEPEPRQLPGPEAEAEPETEGLARWLDPDVAVEIGCPPGRRGPRRTP